MPHHPKVSSACAGYHVLGKLGTGSYGVVFKAEERDTGIVAIKCIFRERLSKSGQDNVIREISIMKMLHHRHILKLLDFTWDDKYIYLITEYCEMGDLSRYIVKNRGVPRHLIHRFLQQLAHGLRFLRRHNISHFDLKPQNLFVTKQPKLCLKIADFGFAQLMSDEERSNKVIGSPAYMAPEMLICKEYSAKADLWSVGVILFECLFGKLPLPNKCCDLIVAIEKNAVIQIPANAKISPACQNLLSRLLQYDPDNRIDFDSFFSHEYVDLEHYPSEKNYEKGVAFVHRAIEYDTDQQYHEAFDCYCEALRYMIPYLEDMDDHTEKRQLQQKVLEYTTRAEELKSIFFVVNRDNLNEPKNHALDVLEDDVQAVFSIYELFSRPYLAVECGFIGQMFVVEGKYKLAIRKLRKALNTLIHYCLGESLEERKNLLDIQVKKWATLLRNVHTLHQAQITTVGSLKSGEHAKSSESKLRSSQFLRWSVGHHSSRKQDVQTRRMAIINSYEQRMKMLNFLPPEIQESVIRFEENKIWKPMSDGEPHTLCTLQDQDSQERCSIM